MYRLAPNRIDRIAFLDTNPKAEDVAVANARESQIARAQAGELRAIMRDEMKPRYLADGPNRAPVLELCMDMAEALGPEVFVRQSRALQTRPDQQDTLRAITVPTLALCGPGHHRWGLAIYPPWNNPKQPMRPCPAGCSSHEEKFAYAKLKS